MHDSYEIDVICITNKGTVSCVMSFSTILLLPYMSKLSVPPVSLSILGNRLSHSFFQFHFCTSGNNGWMMDG